MMHTGPARKCCQQTLRSSPSALHPSPTNPSPHAERKREALLILRAWIVPNAMGTRPVPLAMRSLEFPGKNVHPTPAPPSHPGAPASPVRCMSLILGRSCLIDHGTDLRPSGRSHIDVCFLW